MAEPSIERKSELLGNSSFFLQCSAGRTGVASSICATGVTLLYTLRCTMISMQSNAGRIKTPGCIVAGWCSGVGWWGWQAGFGYGHNEKIRNRFSLHPLEIRNVFHRRKKFGGRGRQRTAEPVRPEWKIGGPCHRLKVLDGPHEVGLDNLVFQPSVCSWYGRRDDIGTTLRRSQPPPYQSSIIAIEMEPGYA